MGYKVYGRGRADAVRFDHGCQLPRYQTVIGYRVQDDRELD